MDRRGRTGDDPAMAHTGKPQHIDPAAVRQLAASAGFRFVGESKVLHDATDDHGKDVFDRAIRDKADQFAL